MISSCGTHANVNCPITFNMNHITAYQVPPTLHMLPMLQHSLHNTCSCDRVLLGSCSTWSCAQTPPPQEENGLVTIEQSLGCADSAVLISNYMFAWRKAISLVYAHAWMTWHNFNGLSKIKTVDSAQPKNYSIVRDPFPCERVGSGNKTM